MTGDIYGIMLYFFRSTLSFDTVRYLLPAFISFLLRADSLSTLYCSDFGSAESYSGFGTTVICVNLSLPVDWSRQVALTPIYFLSVFMSVRLLPLSGTSHEKSIT